MNDVNDDDDDDDDDDFCFISQRHKVHGREEVYVKCVYC